MTQTLPPAISEAEFTTAVVDLALLRGWKIHHELPSQRISGRWSTHAQGHPGFPDWVFARRGVVLLRELKKVGGKVSIGQTGWLAELGSYGGIWTPLDWPRIIRELA